MLQTLPRSREQPEFYENVVQQRCRTLPFRRHRQSMGCQRATTKPTFGIGRRDWQEANRPRCHTFQLQLKCTSTIPQSTPPGFGLDALLRTSRSSGMPPPYRSIAPPTPCCCCAVMVDEKVERRSRSLLTTAVLRLRLCPCPPTASQVPWVYRFRGGVARDWQCCCCRERRHHRRRQSNGGGGSRSLRRPSDFPPPHRRHARCKPYC